jgi:hypothetical protein
MKRKVQDSNCCSSEEKRCSITCQKGWQAGTAAEKLNRDPQQLYTWIEAILSRESSRNSLSG